jgi:hypothetical protein
LKRAFPALPDIEAEVYTMAPWLAERARANGGDWQGPLNARLNNANRKAAVERERLEAKQQQPRWGVNYL